LIKNKRCSGKYILLASSLGVEPDVAKSSAVYRMAPKSKPLPNDKYRIKSSVRLDLYVKLKYESSTIILFVGIRYSMRNLLFDLNNYAWPAN